MQPRSHEDLKSFGTLNSSWLRVFVVAFVLVTAIAAGQRPVEQSRETGYVGAKACASCHSQIHEMWTAGRHSKMIQPATAAAVRGDFSRGTITLHGHSYGLHARDGTFYITESELSGKEQEHRIEYTLGSRRIQHYLTTIDQGRIVVLAPSWDVQRREWFHNTEIVRPDEDDRLVMQQWNKSCVGCHVSRETVGYQPATRTFHTEWMDFGTSCERCHGPGRAHVEQYGRGTQSSQNTRSQIVRPTRLDANTSSMVCAQCHSLRTAINPEYKAGDDYYDYFVPNLEYAPYERPHVSKDPPYWADGRPRRFSNDAIGLWESQCFLKGGATCTTCHTNPHLPDIDRNPQLAGAASNALCTKCHQEIGARVTAHTRHAATSAGSACVECHMPKTVVSIKSTMRDHTIGMPAPENTVKFGIPNACTECHKDKSPSWAVDTLKSWWPDGRRQLLERRAEAFTSARAGKPEAVEPLASIAQDGRYPPLVRANAVGYLGRFATPASDAALVRATTADEPAIRIAAFGALREPGHTDREARVLVLRGLSDPKRAVRIAALLTVIAQGAYTVTPGDLARFRFAGQELLAWSRANLHDPELQRAQGIVNLLGGDTTAGADALQASYDLDPEGVSVRFFLAVARLTQGRADEARELLRKVPKTDPSYERAQQQLAKLPQ